MPNPTARTPLHSIIPNWIVPSVFTILIVLSVNLNSKMCGKFKEFEECDSEADMIVPSVNLYSKMCGRELEGDECQWHDQWIRNLDLIML